MPGREVSAEGLQVSVRRCGAQHQTLSPRLYSSPKAEDSTGAFRSEVAVLEVQRWGELSLQESMTWPSISQCQQN